MTNYNDGKWHGWNGGECPVHPKTKINGLEPGGTYWTANAEDCEWRSFKGAFRVIKEYKEPREFWISNNDCYAHATEESAMADHLTVKHGYIHVREVSQ